MRATWILVLGAMFAAGAAFADEAAPKGKDPAAAKPPSAKSEPLKPEERTSEGSVTVAGSRIDYRAVAGNLVVHPKGWDDAAREPGRDDQQNRNQPGGASGEQNPTAEASMFYVAYFAKGTAAEARPLTFLYNGGPGSSTIWLHMGAFGPRRVVTADDAHSPAAPYAIGNNDQSLLDASDLVFVDAPGTGFSRISGKDKEKAFYGVDADAFAFAEFITEFLSKHSRWNSPKYLFGESYGTTRSAALIRLLETDRHVDFNGVMLLGQILNFNISTEIPQFDPGVDLPYQLALPTYAATAWYHHKLASDRGDLQSFLAEVEHFATTDYAQALQAGATLDPAQRDAVASKLHEYTGLPVEYIKKADLRVNSGEFRKTLQDDGDMTTGRYTTTISGPTMEPLSKEAEYDPFVAAISSAFVSAFNDYVRKTLNYDTDAHKTYKSTISVDWNWQHQPPNFPRPLRQAANVMPDLAWAMKYNPSLKVQLNAGYFDLATPFYRGVYEMRHLPMPAKLQANIEYRFYQSGHMAYVREAALKELHENVAAFIRATGHLAAAAADSRHAEDVKRQD